MTVTVNDVIRIVAEWDMPSGTVAQLVWHYLGSSGGPASDTEVLVAVEAMLDAAWDHIAARVAQEVTGSTIQLFKWDFTLNRWDGLGEVPLIGADGSSTDHMLPHGDAGLIKIFTLALRRQSRKYIHGLIEGTQENGLIDALILSDLALFAADLDDNVAAGTLTLKYCTFNTDPLSPLFETESLANGTVQAEAIVAYQRRRRPGTGI